MKQNRLISIGAFILVLALSGLMTGCMEKDVYDRIVKKNLFLTRINISALRCAVMSGFLSTMTFTGLLL